MYYSSVSCNINGLVITKVMTIVYMAIDVVICSACIYIYIYTLNSIARILY